MLTNCVNCGAPLRGNRCGYCGTEYTGSDVYASFEPSEATGVLSVGGVEYHVYLGSMEAHTLCEGAHRDSTGRLQMERPVMKRKFSLIEL